MVKNASIEKLDGVHVAIEIERLNQVRLFTHGKHAPSLAVRGEGFKKMLRGKRIYPLGYAGCLVDSIHLNSFKSRGSQRIA
jgi:hypothetical protein